MPQFITDFSRERQVWGTVAAAAATARQVAPGNPLFRQKALRRLTEKPRLHVGCGRNICVGWTNQDVVGQNGVDLVVDVRRLRRYIPESRLDAIMASHILEHLPRHEARRVLGDFWTWLKPGGELWLAVPDLEVLADIAKDPCSSAAEREKAMLLIATPKPGHVSAWLWHDLAEMLKGVGFTGIERWTDPPDGFKPDSGCWSHCLAGRTLSLNVFARKGED